MSTSKEIVAALKFSDTLIGENASAIFSNHPLLMGIGTTPFDRVSAAMFCGKLPIMVNFQAAAIAGAAFYQILVDDLPTTDSWTTYKWNGRANVLQTVNIKWVGPSGGCYPVHPLKELFLWQSPAMGGMLDSRALADGLHSIELQFLDADGKPIPRLKSGPMRITIHNRQCAARLTQTPRKLTPSAPAFGVRYEPAYS